MESQRSLSARIGGLTRHAKHGSRELALSGRDGLLLKFGKEVDPEGVLSASERASRAIALRRAHMTRIAIASAKARSRKRAADEG